MSNDNGPKGPLPDSFDDKVMLHVNRVYAITINPVDGHQYFVGRPKDGITSNGRLEKFKSYWTSHSPLSKIALYAKFWMNTELSEPVRGDSATQRPRLHLHGVIRFDDIEGIKQFLLYEAVDLSAICRYDIKPLEDWMTWRRYMYKQAFLGLPCMKNYILDEPDEIFKWPTEITIPKTGLCDDVPPDTNATGSLEDMNTKQLKQQLKKQLKTKRGRKKKNIFKPESIGQLINPDDNEYNKTQETSESIKEI